MLKAIGLVAVMLTLLIGQSGHHSNARAERAPMQSGSLLVGQDPGPHDPPERHIVFFTDNVADAQDAATAIGRQHGISITHIYDRLKGFAARIPPNRIGALRGDPRVLDIGPVRAVRIVGRSLPPRSAPAVSLTAQTSQQASTGLQRIGASTDGVHQTLARKGTGVGVAVLDTGIDLTHPDLLPVQDGKSCVKTKTSNDDNGHGTRVGGIIAARDNATGVVGLAPDVTLYAVKVFDAAGNGTSDDLVCGVNWVTRHADKIAVANMSLRLVGTASPTPSASNCRNADHDMLHVAICKSVKAGIAYVASAGNEATDAGSVVPAAYDEVIAVSAIADGDGKTGSLSSSFPCQLLPGEVEADDSFASFSNFGGPVVISAPGVCINSTNLGGGYAYGIGTSFSAPFVSAAAALYKQDHRSASAAQVKATLRITREPNPITADPDASKEGVLYFHPTITVGPNPHGIGINSTTNRIYVANFWAAGFDTNSTVSVIDGSTNTVAATVPVGFNPGGVGVNVNTNRIYVGNTTSNTVSVIDGSTNTVAATVPVATVGDLAVNATTNRIYAVQRFGNAVAVIDGATNAVVAVIGVGTRPFGAGVNTSTNRVYVANENSNAISVIDGGTNAITATIAVPVPPFHLAVNTATNRIYTASRSNNSVMVIDGSTNSVVATIPVGLNSNGVAVNTTTNRVYVANWDSNNISVIDGATNTLIATVGIGTAPYRIGVNPLTKRIYVGNYFDNTVSVIQE